MSFTITHRDGGMEEGNSESLPSLVAELDGAIDNEHPDIAVTDDDSGWMLSAFQGGKVVWENPDDEDQEPRHLPAVTREGVLRLMNMVANDQLDGIEAEDWQPGYSR